MSGRGPDPMDPPPRKYATETIQYMFKMSNGRYSKYNIGTYINYNVLMNNSNNLGVTIKVLNINKTKNMNTD